MEISFKSKKLELLFMSYKSLQKKYGQGARKLARSFHVLQAANTLKDVPRSIRPHPLKNNRQGQFSVDGKHPIRIIFEPSEEHNVEDLSSIKAINILEITD